MGVNVVNVAVLYRYGVGFEWVLCGCLFCCCCFFLGGGGGFCSFGVALLLHIYVAVVVFFSVALALLFYCISVLM